MRPQISNYSSPKVLLLCGGEEPDNTLQVFKDLFPDAVNGRIESANIISEHVIDLFGSGRKKLSPEGRGYQPIDWHSDFKTGFSWNPATFFRNIRYGEKKGADIKVPWELSRFHHVHMLGQAYMLTRKNGYAQEYMDQISDWISHNPVGFGVNWVSPLEVAIRAVNWLISLEYFSQDEAVNRTEFLRIFYQSIREHGLFIYRHREYTPDLRTNHFIGNLAGLFIIAVYCPFFSESGKWQKFAVNQLTKEIVHQVYADGCDFEASTMYHRFVLEMFFYAEIIGKRAGISLGDEFSAKLKSMFEFVLHAIKSQGTVPQVGDNDSARFIRFKPSLSLELSYLLAIAAIYYADPEFKFSVTAFDEEAFWIFGGKGKKVFDGLPCREKLRDYQSFSNAGWYVIRCVDTFCFISCGYSGQQGKGGHAHNDKLSFELSVRGQDIFVDPGTYVYTSYPEQRNDFRSTRYHNTIRFNKTEQNPVPIKHMFSLPERVRIISGKIVESKHEIQFEGEILYKKYCHKRKIIVHKSGEGLTIVDEVFKPASDNVEIFFHLSPQLYYENGGLFTKIINEKIALVRSDGYVLEKQVYYYSPEYGIRVRGECLRGAVLAKKATLILTTHFSWT
ncbi:MAG: alginate lyase family protein [Ignavibacteriales bacterium]|nr:alginate lyase family protein [Ignavibacteriales bacterium]